MPSLTNYTRIFFGPAESKSYESNSGTAVKDWRMRCLYSRLIREVGKRSEVILDRDQRYEEYLSTNLPAITHIE